MPYVVRKAGSYYLRLAIPRSLQASYNRQEVCYPLHASSALHAKALALSLASQLLSHFGELQQMVKQANEPSLTSILEKMETGDGKKYEGKANLLTGEISLVVNPNDPEDVKAGADWQAKTVEQMRSLQPPPAKQSSLTPKQMIQEFMGIKQTKLSKAIEEFTAKKKGEKNKSFDHIENGLEHFEEWVLAKYGNILVHKINKDDLKEYRTVLENYTTNRSRQADKKLSVSTIFSRLNFIENFFRYCQEQTYYPDGEKRLPTYGNKPDKYDAVEGETSYEAFTPEELKRIFNPLHYRPLLDEPHKFWAPLLGLFTGPRRGELVALKLHNINNHNPEKIWTIKFIDKVKNKNSRRTIPLHPALIEAGFLDYVADVQEIYGSHSILFPYSKNPGKMLGDCFARYLDRLKITDNRKVYHSFRKNVAQCTLTAFPNYAEHYIGHLHYSIHNTIYSGREFPFKFYLTQLETVDYPFLDFSKIKYKKGDFISYLKREKIVLNRFNREGIEMPDSMKGKRKK